MRVLDVCPWVSVPPERGGAVRVYNLLHELSRRHEVRGFGQGRLRLWPLELAGELPITPTFRVTRYSNPLAALFLEWSDRAWASPSLRAGTALRLARPARLRALLDWADVTLVEGPWQFEHCRREQPDAPLVLSTQNVESERFASYAGLGGSRRRHERRLRFIEETEAAAIQDADLTVAVSQADRLALIHRLGADPDRVVVVPNGADTERLRPADPEEKARVRRELGLPEGPTAVFVGSRFPPNQTGLAWVRRLAEAASDFTFLVVGTVARPERRGNLVATGRVPDVAPYLQAADVALCPIDVGGGTKVKLFEGLAAGLPSVVLREALHGTDLVPDEHVVVAGKSVPAFVAALAGLVEDPESARALGAAGRRFVVERHDWRLAAAELERALSALLDGQQDAQRSRGASASQFAS